MLRTVRTALPGSLALVLSACGAPRATAPAASAPMDVEDAGGAPDGPGFEGDAHGFPVLRDAGGERRADGEFTQWLEGERLHVRIRFESAAERRVIEERAVLRQAPEPVQESWSWSEHANGELVRRFAVDLETGAATAEVRDEDGVRTWSEELDVEPGRTFVGAGWPHALRAVRARLLAGEAVELLSVGFTPEPRLATVELTFAGPEVVPVGGRELAADRFRVHPVIPWLARLVVEVPDADLWLTRTPPYAFLRWEGALAEPSDPIVRVDALHAEPSEAARPERSAP